MIVRPLNGFYRTWLQNLAKLTQGGGLIPSLKILAGTLYVLTRELDDNILTHRERTMTFTCFVFFDMMNAMACRSQRKSITQLAHNYTLYVAIGMCFAFVEFLFSFSGLSLVGQILVIYWSPLQSVFQTESLHIRDLVLLTVIASSVLVTSEALKYWKRSVNFTLNSTLKFCLENAQNPSLREMVNV